MNENETCGRISPRGTTCIEPKGHEQRTSHSNGSVIHWLTPDQRRADEIAATEETA